MAATIEAGWLRGTLEDDTGRAWPIERFPQTSRGRLSVALDRCDLCLHTTETDGYIPEMRVPSQWQCGEGIIGQHIELGWMGDSAWDVDGFLQQIEMVSRSQLGVWLPRESTLGPAVALTAFLHRKQLIRSGLVRPNPDWPLKLDRLPAATTDYYRRHDGTWRKAGVYGHVELPGRNAHWDPGSFNYPVFFERVRAAIAVQENDMTDAQEKALRKLENFLDAIAGGLDGQDTGAALGTRVAASVAKVESGATAPAGHCAADCDCRVHSHEGSARVTVT